MPPAHHHCLRALQLSLKLLGVRSPESSPLIVCIFRIITWLRKLWRRASHRQTKSAAAPSQPETDRNRDEPCALQAALPPFQPPTLAHDTDDDLGDENKPAQRILAVDPTQTANVRDPTVSPQGVGIAPVISPPSFPALSPTAPELLVPTHRRGGTLTKTDVNVTLEPNTKSFERDNPAGWIERFHPEGTLYYAHGSMNIFTDYSLQESPTSVIIQGVVSEVEQFYLANGILPDPQIDLVLGLTSDGNGPPTCEYYLADHNKRIIFWHHAFEMERLPRCYEVYGPRSPHHIQIELTAQYWFHCACFPDNLPVTPELVRELGDIVLYSISDSLLDPQAGTLQHSTDDLMKMLTVVESLKEDSDTSCSRITLSRFLWTFEYHKFYNFHGETFARLDRQTSVFGYVPKRSLVLRIFTPLLFNAPTEHLRTLEEVYVDEILNLTSWSRVVDALSLEWQEHILYATVLMNASIAFLAIPTVDNGEDTSARSAAQVAGYISVIASLGSVFVGLILLHRNRKGDINAMAGFLGSYFHSHLGLEPLALLYSIPFALLMWGAIAFLIAFLLMCLQSSNDSTRAIVTFSIAVVMFGVLGCSQPLRISAVLQTMERKFQSMMEGLNRVSPSIEVV